MNASSRAGFSIRDLLACMLALAGGVCIGAHFLGVGVDQLAYTALHETQLLKQLPEDWRPAPPQSMVRDPEQDRLEAEVLGTELRAELRALRNEIARLEATTLTAAEGDAPAPESKETEKDLATEKTLAYWNRLCEVSMQLAELDAGAERAVDELNTARVLLVRLRAYRYGAKAIRSLEAENVDAQVLEFGQSLLTGYERAAEFYEKTLAIWQGGNGGKAVRVDGTSWGATRQQFEQESALLRAKAAELRQRLMRRHGAEFLPMEL